MVVVGGVIPGRDVDRLKALGVRGVFPGGTHFKEFVDYIQENVSR
jgi:methylmalonyl-CoA mutase C-terminal domain/subunit